MKNCMSTIFLYFFIFFFIDFLYFLCIIESMFNIINLKKGFKKNEKT